MAEIILFPWVEREFAKTLEAIREVYLVENILCVDLSERGNYDLFVDGLIAKLVGVDGQESGYEPLNYLFFERDCYTLGFELEKFNFSGKISEVVISRVDAGGTTEKYFSLKSE